MAENMLYTASSEGLWQAPIPLRIMVVHGDHVPAECGKADMDQNDARASLELLFLNDLRHANVIGDEVYDRAVQKLSGRTPGRLVQTDGKWPRSRQPEDCQGGVI